MSQRKKAPLLFIERKPLVKPPQDAFLDYSVPARRGPAVLDADKIAKMDADLERLGINTLKGPKKTTAVKDFALPSPQALDVQKKSAIPPKQAQQPSAAMQTPEKAQSIGATPVEITPNDEPVCSEKMDESSIETVQKPVQEQKRDVAPTAPVDTADKSIIEHKKDTTQKAAGKETTQTPTINEKKDITANVTVEEAQKPIIEQPKNFTAKITPIEEQKPEAPKPGIRKKVTSLLKARKSAIAKLKGSLSRMKFPESWAPTSPSAVPAAEQPEATQSDSAVDSTPVATPPKTPPQASIPLPPSPVATILQTPPQAAIPLPASLIDADIEEVTAGLAALSLSSLTTAPKSPVQTDTPRPLSPIDTELETLTAAAIALPSSPISTAPTTSLQIEIPRPLSPVDTGPKTLPEALIPLPPSPRFNTPPTPPAAAVPLPASPTTEWHDIAPQNFQVWSVLQDAATPQTPLLPAPSFPYTPETTTTKTAPEAAFRHLNAPLVTAPKSMTHVASVFPPTPDTEPLQRPQALPTTWSHTPVANAIYQTPESLPLYLPTPETEASVAAPLLPAFCPQTPETPTPWVHAQEAFTFVQTPEPTTPNPRDLWLSTTPTRDEWGMTTSCSVFLPQKPQQKPQQEAKQKPNIITPHIIYPQVTSIPQTPPNTAEPMPLSSNIYHMSPGHSIHETPSPTKFVMSCVPKTSDPIPDWELYFNQHLANTISAFSESCRFEHPGANRQNSNPFSALSGGGNNNRGTFGRATSSSAPPFSLNKDTIYKDLTEERPSWALSAYGPGRDAPEQLWGGYPIEQSFEEARLHFEMGRMAGNPQAALNDIQGLENQVQQKMQNALQNLDGAINFIVQSQNNHPNRNDICQTGAGPTTGEFAVGKRPLGQQTTVPSSNPFGQPAAPAQQTNNNPFGGGATSAFGQPSTMGQTSAFGQPSAPGGGSAFGQPSALGGNTGFGQTSALGQKPSPFGQPSTLGSSSSPFAQASATGFGQTSALGQKPNPFGAPSMQPAQPTAFGQPSQPTSGFGQPSLLGAKPNPFAAAGSGPSASPFGAFANNNNTSNAGAAQSSSPFGALGGTSNNTTTTGFANPLQQPGSNPFGQPQQTPSNEVSMDSAPTSTTNSFANAGNTANRPSPFGLPAKPTPFGQPAQPAAANPFAQAASAAPTTAFGAPAIQQQQQQQPAAAAPTAAAAGAGPYGPNATRQHPDYHSYAQKSPTGQLLRWQGKPVTYKTVDGEPVPGIQNFDGSWTKIWFPDGPPPYNRDTEPVRPYTDAETALYDRFVATGTFQLAATGGGGMPLAAPRREMCTWNF